VLQEGQQRAAVAVGCCPRPAELLAPHLLQWWVASLPPPLLFLPLQPWRPARPQRLLLQG
jgi:hypothetical protein